MAKKLTRIQHIHAAARANSNLNAFAALIAILEGGCVSHSNRSRDRIIAIAKQETHRQLRIYDKHVAAATSMEKS